VGHGLKMRVCNTTNPLTGVVGGFSVGHFGGLLVSLVEETEAFLEDGELVIADV